MPNLINDKAVLESAWVQIESAEDLSKSNIYVPIHLWIEHADKLIDRKDAAPIVAGDTDLEDVIDSIKSLDLIAIHFPAFTDGRGYSQARLLREQYNFKNDLRAIGDVLADQLFFMKRCGISSYELAPSVKPETALAHFETFSSPYQTSVDQPEPLFRRR